MFRSMLVSAVGLAWFAMGCGGVSGSVSDPVDTGSSTAASATPASASQLASSMRGLLPTRDGAALRQRMADALSANSASNAGAGYKVESLAIGTNGIQFHGGTVMTAAKNLYFIWYGNWGTTTEDATVTTFAKNINAATAFNAQTTYNDASGAPVTNSLVFKKAATDPYSQGTWMEGISIADIVANAINTKALPKDANGIYTVVTSPDVNVDGFCTAYCGFHADTIVNKTSIKYAFVGHPSRCPSTCEPQATSPNGDAASDAMISTFAYEVNATVTDPLGDAWYDANGMEAPDKCAWNFGATTKMKSGALYNTTLANGKHYLLQGDWANANGGSCVLTY
jgi:hypothetical protein